MRRRGTGFMLGSFRLQVPEGQADFTACASPTAPVLDSTITINAQSQTITPATSTLPDQPQQPRHSAAKRHTDSNTSLPLARNSRPPSIAISSCAAHLQCHVVSSSEVDDHLILQCHIDKAWVRARYWNGKNFISQDPDPPFLVFLGTKVFGHVHSAQSSPDSSSSTPSDP